MLPYEKDEVDIEKNHPDTQTPKMKAYLKMQELRKETAKYDISDSERAKALDERFGVIEKE